MNERRRTPEELLAQAHADESRRRQGSLRIFFGYAAGVGKTFAMLQAARVAQSQGRDVVVGYIEPHARPETQRLCEGLEILPVREFDYRGVVLREFHVDAALQRKAEILLVDELAHTNAVGSRHEKRWQDIEELLRAGIDVWTTLNVQHIESLHDVIGQITGVNVRETVPDRIFDAATELELVDISPDELLVRLQAGKIYVPEQAQRAIDAFFQKSNLSALRELSLRQTAQRIHTDVESARREKAVVEPWATADRLLVCVGPSPTTPRVIRTAKRMAVGLDAPWLAVSVDVTGAPAHSSAKQQVAQHFQLAERLGAESVTLAGASIADTLLEYARSRNVTKILIGKTHQPRWRRLLWGTVVDEILERSGTIDVYVIHGEEDGKQPIVAAAPQRALNRWPYGVATLAVLATSVVAYGLRSLHLADAEANTVMLFLAAVAWIAFTYGRGPAIYASVLAVAVFDYYFVPPYLTLAVSDVQYLVTFAVMLSIGIVISTLTSRLHAQVESTRERERRTHSLYELGKQLSSLYGRVFLANAVGERLSELLSGEVTIYLRSSRREPELVFGQTTSIANHALSSVVAAWVIDHQQWAGAGTNTLPSAIGVFLPLIGSNHTQGAIGLRVADSARLLDPDQRRLLEACASQLALALERDELAIAAAEARIEAEAEQVRSSLLSSVSHDLKTPLASISGACSSLLTSNTLDDATRRILLETVADEASRLNRLLENILQMSQLDAGATAPNRQWHVLEELIGSALHRTRQELAKHVVKVNLSPDLPLILVDGLLIEQIFVNLLENAARYTPVGTEITIRAVADDAWLRVLVSDNGPGIPAGAEQKVFEKFYRATPRADGGRGSGLGLAICRAIAKTHGGNVTVSNQRSGGAEFVLQLPLERDAPRIDVG